MGIFGLGHRHISPETLTEYLDGRLRSQTRERLERVMAGCADCRLEMESLRDTVAMLRQLPVMAPRRSFIMSAPPQVATQAVQRARPISPFRVPQWAYAGAASVAALALAVLVSVDASGLAAPDLPSTTILRHSEEALSTEDLEVIRREITGAREGSQVETPPPQARAESIQVERIPEAEAPPVAEAQASAAAASETQAPPVAVAEMQAQAPAVAESQAQAAPVAVSQAETATQKNLESPVEQIQTVEGPANHSAQDEQPAQPASAETAAIQVKKAPDAQPETVEALTSPTGVPDQAAPEPAQVQNQAQEAPIAFEELRAMATPGTPLLWRLLEAAAAVLFLALTAAFLLKRRAARRF